MSSWLSSLTGRLPFRTIRKSTKRHSLPMLLELLEDRAVPTTSHSYLTAGTTYSQNFNNLPQNTTVAPNIAYAATGPFDLDAQTTTGTSHYTGKGLDGWQFGNAVGGSFATTNAGLRVNPGNSSTLGLFF